jgi:hypothetical protein
VYGLLAVCWSRCEAGIWFLDEGCVNDTPFLTAFPLQCQHLLCVPRSEVFHSIQMFQSLMADQEPLDLHPRSAHSDFNIDLSILFPMLPMYDVPTQVKTTTPHHLFQEEERTPTFLTTTRTQKQKARPTAWLAFTVPYADAEFLRSSRCTSVGYPPRKGLVVPLARVLHQSCKATTVPGLPRI